MNFEHKITTTTTNNNNNNNDDCIKKKSNPINQSFKNFKLCGGTLICVIPIADKLVVVSDKRSINKSTGEIISDDIEKIIQINSNSVISITNVIYMDYGPKAPFPPYDVIAKTKEILQKKSNNLTNSESKIIQLKLQQSVQNYLNQIPKKYWPHSATNPLFQILLFENNSFLQMTIFTVYCDTISGINVSYTGIDIKSSYLMAFGNPSLLMNAKNIPELDTLLSDKTFITINNPNYQGFVTEQEAIAVSKLIIRQSAQYWNLIPGNINDIGTNLDVVVISCSKGIIFKEKSTIN